MEEKIIFDGAFGTYVVTQNIELDFPEMANIAAKETVLRIHREYIAAGANAIKTNTFAANRELVPQFPVLKSIIENGFAIATQAVAHTDASVFADMGPINSEDAANEYIEIADIFLACGATRFLFETLNETKNLGPVIAHIRSKVENPVIITSFAVSQDGYTKLGNYYKDLFDEASGMGADYVGLNCICGPAHMLNLIRDIPAGKYNLIAMPNAGYPSTVNGRTIYVNNPAYFAAKLWDMDACGVKILGGCCGTTPEHIRQFTAGIKTGASQKLSPPIIENPVKAAAKNDFQNTVIAIELSAPLDTDGAYVWKAAAVAKEAGADFVTIPDSPLGKARANSFMIASSIQRQVGIKAIPHVCCRDKNQIAIKGDLIGANMDQVSTVLAITGDSVAKADRGEAKNVFGFNSFQLIAFIKSLNETIFSSNPYTICGALNINAPRFDIELKRAESKIAQGVDCLFTQPILSQRNIENYFRAKEELPCKIIACILPLAGYKNALFLNNEVPGIEIPQEIIDKLRDKGPEDAKEISIQYAISIVEKIKHNCDGYYIMTPLKKIEFAAEITRYIRRNTQC